jgi:hypothetical protein
MKKAEKLFEHYTAQYETNRILQVKSQVIFLNLILATNSIELQIM